MNPAVMFSFAGLDLELRMTLCSTVAAVFVPAAVLRLAAEADVDTVNRTL